MKSIIFIGLFFCATVVYGYTYSDYDVDGVEDSIDECPHTPFDILVDKRGCEEGKPYRGALTFQAGIISASGSKTENITNVQLYLNYRYHDWDIALSTFNDIQNTIENLPNTYYVSTGYRFTLLDKVQSKLSIGAKQTTRQNDYYINTNLDYSISAKQNIFLFYSYTVAEDSSDETYDNFHTLSLGTGLLLADNWYSVLSYDFSGASLEKTKDYRAVSWSNTVMLSSLYYLLATYSYGLNVAASDHAFSIQFGVNFD